MNSGLGSCGHRPDSVPRSPRGPCWGWFQLPPGWSPHASGCGPSILVPSAWRTRAVREPGMGWDSATRGLRGQRVAGKGGMLREPPTSLQDAAPSSTFLRGPQGLKERGQEGPPAPAPKGGRVGPGGSPTGLVQLSWELGALLGIRSSPGSRSTGAGPEPRTALPVQPRSTHADPRGRASWPGSG